MRRGLLFGGAGLAIVAALAASLLLAFAWLPATEGLRRQLVAERLSHYWGEPVTISGKVELALWPRPVLRVEGLTSTTDGVSPVQVRELRLLFARWTRMATRPLLFAMAVEDARLEFPLKPSADAAPGTLLSSPVAFFSVLPRLRLKNVVFDFVDPQDNWRFSLDVSQVQSRLRDGVEYLEASASLNGSPLRLAFQFDREPHPPVPEAPPYGAALSVEGPGLSAQVHTRSWRAAFDDNLTLSVAATSSSIGDLLEVAGIARTVDGRGTLAATLLTDPARISARGITLDLDFTSGVRTAITGSVADLLDATGIDLTTVTDIKPGAQPASSLLDITVTRLSGRFHDGPKGLMLSEAELTTNAFSQNLRDIGPISVASIRRDDAGRVALIGISIQGSPDPDPLFHLTGNVGDTLGIKDISLAGDFDLPLDDVLDVPDSADGKLGRLVGAAAITDAGGPVRLETFSAELRGSDLLSAGLKLRDASATRPDESVMEVTLDVPKLAPLAKVLGTSTSFSGGVGFSGTFERKGQAVRSKGRLDIGRTQVNGTLSAEVKDGRPRIFGPLSSPSVHVDELSNLLFGGPDGAPKPRIAVAGVHVDQARSLDLAHAVDLDIDVKADRIEGIGVSAGNLSATLRLDKGTFKADPVTVTIGRGRLQAALTEADGERMRIKGSGEGWPLEGLAGGSTHLIRSGTVAASFDVTADFGAEGNPLRTLDGGVTARIEDGNLGTGMLDLAGLGLFGSLFNPAVLSGESHLRCVRIPLQFSAGVGRTDPAIIVETEHVRAVGRGTVNMARETVDLDFTPRPLNGGGAGYSFTVKGPLAKPAVALGGKTQAPVRGGCSG